MKASRLFIDASVVFVCYLGLTLTFDAIGRANAAGPKDITIFMGSAIQQSSVFIAAEEGYFKAQGLNATVTQFSTGAEAMDSFRAGQGDILMTGDFPSMKLWSLDPQMIGFAAVVSDDEIPVVVAKSDIRGVQDLRGKRVATKLGSTFEVFTYRYLATGGLGKSDVKIVDLNPPEMVIALDKGEIDAFAWNEPFGMKSREFSGDRVRVLANGKGIFTEWILLCVRKQWAEQHRDTMTALLRALDQANKLIREKPTNAAALITKATKIARPVVDALLPKFNFDISYTKKMRDDMDRMAGFMIERKVLAGQIDWKNHFDASYLRTVRPDLVD